ncbi:sensor histidine kinase [Acidisoma cladoniae]|jgi:two-component sensor histidine kinase|uniref:sensor histidine kinase n=1 Tax=Acidisoma cladoniae TaxID=3040935 RepID=UPI00254E38C7|nr:histidine kinase dimerization/phosphoacceptor domain -containing protein [Acidisoma sp. PAMC 29798]
MTEQDALTRILVVDDNPDDRALVRRELDVLFSTSEIIEPNDTAEFDAALEAAVPDLVVTDLDIRWSNGAAVLSAVKARYPACPVVMFTGTGNETIAVELMKSGLDDYVVKSPRQLPRLRASLKLAFDVARSRSTLTAREAQLVAMVAQRDTIVRELHHRVKNNLQTMMSLLRVRGRQVDAATRAHFDEIEGRINALGAVQARIYAVGSLDNVDFGAALSDISETLTRVYNHTTLDRDFGGPLSLDVGRAMPLALLCYEIILNALKHAWPETKRGRLTLRIRIGSDFPEIRIEDDGMGFDTGSVVKGLGTRLVRSLAQEARVEIETLSKPGDGTTVTLRLI